LHACRDKYMHVSKKDRRGEKMSEGTITVRKAVPIIVATWILSLITTLMFVYADPSLFNLQTKQNMKEHQVEIVRFFDPDEKNVTGLYNISTMGIDDVAVFVWTPNNSNSNAILAIYAYFEYYYEDPPQLIWDIEYRVCRWELKFGASVNQFDSGVGRITRSATSQQEWTQEGSYEWTQTCFKVEPQGLVIDESKETSWILPNQSNYTLRFRVCNEPNMMSGGYSIHTYLRNINVVIEVIDGAW